MRNIRLLLALFFAGTLPALAQQKIPKTDSLDCYATAEFADPTWWQNAQKSAFGIALAEKYPLYFSEKTRLQKLTETNTDDWEMTLFDERAELLQYLKSAPSLSVAEKEAWQHEIKWNYWSWLLAYPVLKSQLEPTNKRIPVLPKVMLENFPVAALTDNSQLMYPSFRRMLPNYVTYKNSEANQFMKYPDLTKAAIEKVNFAQKTLKSNALDYTTAQLALRAKGQLSPGAARYIIGQVYSPALQNLLASELAADLAKKELTVAEEQAASKKSISAYPKLTLLDGSTKDFGDWKGKLIYVDFWASWCGPCRAEFVHSKKMHDALTPAQREKIAFVFVSIDEDKDAWKKAVEDLKLPELGANAHSVEAAGKYQVRTIPRYMIIGKDGKILEVNATRPSQPETITKLLELIK